MSLVIRTEVDIDAPAQRVWTILLNFSSYAMWNPSIRAMRGRAERGAPLELDVPLLPNGGCVHVHATLTELDSPRRLCWIGVLLTPKLFCGDHQITLQPLSPDSVRLVQQETFSGLLLPLLAPWLRRRVQRLYDQTSVAVKGRSEAVAPLRHHVPAEA